MNKQRFVEHPVHLHRDYQLEPNQLALNPLNFNVLKALHLQRVCVVFY